MRSKYIVYPQPEQVDIWEEEITPAEEGEILCQAEKSLISLGTELHALRGVTEPGTNWSDWVKFPFRPGYSMVGHVIEVGKGVNGVQVGDRVATYSFHQQFFKVKLYDATTGQHVPEGFEVYVLPDWVSSEEGTWRSLAVTTQNALRRASFQFGEVAVVVGLGILGQLVTQYLAAAGAHDIIAIDPTAGRLHLAEKHGATLALQMSVSDAEEQVRKVTRGWLADVVFDVTGHPSTLAPCIGLVRRFGRLVLLGDTPTPSEQHLGPGVVFKSIAILGIHGYGLRSGLITDRISALDAPQTYRKLLEDRSNALGIILDWTAVN